MKDIFKKFLPKSFIKKIRPVYHGSRAWLAHKYYDDPTLSLKVIGVTGTAGKSTVVNMLAHVLTKSGKRTGFTTTTNFCLGDEVLLNKHGLSMPDGRLLAFQLNEMRKNGCRYAIVECTSEGLAQKRHLGIEFDAAIFTNLSPAHLDAHGSYENYRAAKGKLFECVAHSKKQNTKIGVNMDDTEAKYYLNFHADSYFGVGFDEKAGYLQEISKYTLGKKHLGLPSTFEMNGQAFELFLPGEFNLYNASLAVASAVEIGGVSLKEASEALKTFKGVPGRMEDIANDLGFRVIVDYACEPRHFMEVLPVVRNLTSGKLIHVFGATGGHRDVSKRFRFGEISAEFADVIVITNDDVYESDEMQIIEDIKSGVELAGEKKKEGLTVLVQPERRKAIREALRLAQIGDTVLFTGKGSEQFLVLPKDTRIEWDERKVVREELKNLKN